MCEILSLIVHTNRLMVWTSHLMESIRFKHVVHFQDYKMKANDLLKPEQFFKSLLRSQQLLLFMISCIMMLL